MLRRMFNWDLLDILYLRLLDSHSQSGSVRWDGRRIDPTPKVGSLAPELQELLRQKTHLDEKIYRAVVNR